jgi:ribokinase
MVSCVGKDAFGEGVLNNFSAEGIDATHVRIDEKRSTGLASIMVDDEAQNCILLVPGANQALTPDDVRAAGEALRSAKLLLCQLEVPLETTLEACRMARAAGVVTILNPAPAVPLPNELLALADYCIPNETEIELLTRRPARNRTQYEWAASELLKRGPKAVLLTLGEKGTLIADKTQMILVPALPVQAVDTTGAGDAFIGSLAFFLAQGLELMLAVLKANGIAGLSVTRPGTQTSFPRRAELADFLKEEQHIFSDGNS